MRPRTHGTTTPGDGAARALWRSYARHRRIAAKHLADAERDMEDFVGIARSLERHLGISLGGIDPDEGWLYDVLACIQVDMTTTDANVPRADRPWRWMGQRNGHGTPVIRRPRSEGSGEVSAVRYIALKLGVIPEDYEGHLYAPVTDPHDVNPWHRHPRRKNTG